MFLLFSIYFSSLNLKYLKLTKIELTRFAMKLFNIIYSNSSSLFPSLVLFPHFPIQNHTIVTIEYVLGVKKKRLLFFIVNNSKSLQLT